MRLALSHDGHELVSDAPGRASVDPELAPQCQGGDVVLGLRQQMHGQKPGRQGEFARIEERAGGDRGLVSTASTGHSSFWTNRD